MSHKIHLHKDLSESRIKKDEADSLMSVLTETFINPILCLSNGMVASDEVSNDLLKAKEKGRVAMKKFIDER